MTQRESPSSVFGSQQSKVQAAKDQTTATGQQAMRAGGSVAQGAVAQGRETAAEGVRQAHNLLGEASSQVKEQADAQQKRAAQRLRALGDELASMSGQGDQHGMATDLARQASDRAHRAADWLDQREPGAVVEEVRDYARRHPGMFLAGAALAGVLAGRLTRNLAGAGDGDGGGPMHGGKPGPAQQPPMPPGASTESGPRTTPISSGHHGDGGGR
jgi:hypothetical protein